MHGLKFRNEATNLFAIMARFNALSTPVLYIWGSPALRKAVKNTVWGGGCKIRKARLDISSEQRGRQATEVTSMEKGSKKA
ncbi:hypothetical protein GJAV_G00035780 [Gymnothorax javanicus]|nr:hypothetical protein GJAV_G00035780 [Gymnothorax javanicus]